MAIPPALIGAIARNTDWRLTEYDPWNNGTKSEHIPPEQVWTFVDYWFCLSAETSAFKYS